MKSKEQLRRELTKFNDELHAHSSGAMQALVIRGEYILQIFAAGGQDFLKPYVRTIGHWLKDVKQGKEEPLCVGCDFKFTKHWYLAKTFIFAVPFSDQPCSSIVMAACAKCGEKSDDELLEIAYAGMKELGLVDRKLEMGAA
jgi:hypothetical protein